MCCLASCEIYIALGATNTFIELCNLLQHIEVADILLHYSSIDLIQLRAISRSGDSEDIIYIIFLLAGCFRKFIRRVCCLLRQSRTCQLIIGNQLLSLAVRVLFVECIRNVHQLNKNHHFAFRAHSFNRLTQALTSLCVFGLAIEIDVSHTLFTQDIVFRVLRVVSEEADTLVLHLDSEFSQTLFLCGVGSSLIKRLHDLRSIGIDGFVCIRASGVHFVPRTIGVGKHLVLNGLMEERYIHHTLLCDDGVFLNYSNLFSRLSSRGFLLLCCARQSRNSNCQRDYKDTLFHNVSIF